MSDSNENYATTIRDLATGLSEVVETDGHPHLVIPDSYHIEDLEKFMVYPMRTKAIVALDTLDGLIGYADKFKTNATAVFVCQLNGSVAVVIDYDETEKAHWRDHVAKFVPKHTVEWERWMRSNEQWKDQRSFAEFIEENVADITKPSGAEMLEIASTLEAKTAVEFKSGVRLDNGTNRLTFAADTVAKAGDKGTLEIPQQFELALEPFIGGDAYPLIARFRYKINEGKLTLRYQLVNPHKIIEAAVEEIIKKVNNGISIKPFIGNPPAK